MPRSDEIKEEPSSVWDSLMGGITGLFDGIAGNCQRQPKDDLANDVLGKRTSRRTRASPPGSRHSSRSRDASQDRMGDLRDRPPSRAGSSASSAGSMSRFGARAQTRGGGSRDASMERGGSRSRSNSRDRSSDGGDAEQINHVLYKAKWRSFDLFNKLDEEDMTLVVNKMKVRSFNKGDTIIKKGSIGTTMFFIDLGTCKAEIRGKTATDLKSGDYFGEIAFVATCRKFLRDPSDTEPPEQAVRVADVVASSPCRIFELSVKDFITVLQGNTSGKKVLASLKDTVSERKSNVNRIEAEYKKEKANVRSSREAWDNMKSTAASMEFQKYG